MYNIGHLLSATLLVDIVEREDLTIIKTKDFPF